jgi:hypothetical protein
LVAVSLKRSIKKTTCPPWHSFQQWIQMQKLHYKIDRPVRMSCIADIAVDNIDMIPPSER